MEPRRRDRRCSVGLRVRGGDKEPRAPAPRPLHRRRTGQTVASPGRDYARALALSRAASDRRKYGLTETIALLLMNTCTIPGREEICWLRSILGTVLSPSLDGGGRARDLQPNTNQRATAGDDGRRWEDFDRGLLAAEAGGAVVVTAVKGQRYALVARCL